MAADRAGGEPVTPVTKTESESRVRLNAVLYVAVVALACVAVFLGFLLNGRDVDVTPWSGTAETTPGEGRDVGRGVVAAVPEAGDDEQERVAAQLAAATKMVNAFINIDYENLKGGMEAVRSLSSGAFLEQYNKGADGLEKLAVEAQSKMTGEVVWAGLVKGDKDSATVIVATDGTVSNRTTEFKKRSNIYRIQIELVLEKGAWLTQDLQFVEVA